MWSEILVNYGVFVLKIVTVLLVIGVIAAVIFNLKQRREGSLGELQINDLSEEYNENSKKLRDFHLSEEAFKQAEKARKKPIKKRQKRKKHCVKKVRKSKKNVNRICMC